MLILSKQLKILIRQHDTTVAQVSRATKISSKTIYAWLQGQRPRDLSKIKSVAEHFNVSLDFLAFGAEIKSKFKLADYEDEINAGVFEVILRKVRE